MRPKLQEEDSEITKMSIPMLNYYQGAEAHIDKQEQQIKALEEAVEYCQNTAHMIIGQTKKALK